MKAIDIYPASYHTHCQIDDGHGPMEGYVERAVELGFTALGFSCHTPISFQYDFWRTQAKDMPQYFDEFKRLKALYADRIELYLGLELEYMNLSGELAGLEYIDELDYTIASVHHMYHEPSGRYLCIDGPVEELETLLRDNYKGDEKAMCRHYFALQAEMIRNYSFDILAHCDLIKKRNTDNRFFDPTESWYPEAAQLMVDAVIERNVRIEVNTGGLARGATKEAYPAQWILRKFGKTDIPVVISSDAHNAENLDFHYRESMRGLADAGVENLQIFRDRKWRKL